MALTSEQQRVMREGWLSAHPRYPMEQCALDVAAGAALLEYEARNPMAQHGRKTGDVASRDRI